MKSYEYDKKSVLREARKRNLESLLGLLKLKKGDLLTSNKKLRTHKNAFQKTVLTEVFKTTKFPTSETREDLALILNHTTRGIQIWFQNNRHNLGSENETNLIEKKFDLITRLPITKKKVFEKDRLCDILEDNLKGNTKIEWIKYVNYIRKTL